MLIGTWQSGTPPRRAKGREAFIMITAPVLHTFSYIIQEALLSGKRNVTPRMKNGMGGGFYMARHPAT